MTKNVTEKQKANLKPVNTRPLRERKEIARKGAIASNKKKAEKKLLREQLELLMSLDVKNPKLKEQLEDLGIPKSQLNNQMASNVALFRKVLKGDPKAYEVMRDTLGQKPKDTPDPDDKRKVEIIDDLPDNTD